MKTEIKPKGMLICLVALLVVVFLPAASRAQEADAAAVQETAPSADAKAAQQTEESKRLRDNFRYFFEIGGQFRSVSGERPTKFEEYGQTRRGLIARRFGVSSNPAGSPDYFRFLGRDVSELDQQYLLEFGRFGLSRTKIEWNGYSHLYSRGSRSLFNSSGRDGVLTVDDQIQTTLQNTPTASVPAVVQNLYANAPFIEQKSKRNTLNLEQSFQITQNLSVRLNWNRQWRRGNRPMGTGSYERIGTAIGDTFRVHSIELNQPLDSTTDHLTVAASFLKRNWGVNFSYTYSNFNNKFAALTYENPFRITDLQATGAGGVFDRMKMASAQMALEPDNHSQNITVSAFVDLPRNTRLAGAWGWSFWRQDEGFLPYTLNTAIVTGVPAGLNLTSPNSLPEQSLDGEVNTFTQDYLIASKPWKSWTFNVHYRRYDNDNNSRQIHFPGYVGFVESFWRTNIAGVPIENEVQSFTRSNTRAEAIWDISKKYRWKIGYEWEGWLREHRQTTHSNEHSLSTQFTYNPTGRLNSRLTYEYSSREPGLYNPGVKEFALLRMFDQARRLRHDADWQWQWAINPRVGISGTLGYLSDDYDQNYFGLVRYSQWEGSFDLLYMPKDDTTFYVNYSRENYKNSLQLIAKTAVPFDFNNRWNRDQRDTLDNFGVGVTTYLMKGKMYLDLHYVFSNAVTKTTTVNPATPTPNSILNALAQPFPDVKSRLQEVNSDISYEFKNNIALGFRYIYQPYSLDDFAWNNLSPYPINQLPPENDGTRYLLLDSRYSSHNWHVFGVYLRFGK